MLVQKKKIASVIVEDLEQYAQIVKELFSCENHPGMVFVVIIIINVLLDIYLKCFNHPIFFIGNPFLCTLHIQHTFKHTHSFQNEISQNYGNACLRA